MFVCKEALHQTCKEPVNLHVSRVRGWYTLAGLGRHAYIVVVIVYDRGDLAGRAGHRGRLNFSSFCTRICPISNGGMCDRVVRRGWQGKGTSRAGDVLENISGSMMVAHQARAEDVGLGASSAVDVPAEARRRLQASTNGAHDRAGRRVRQVKV
jgi:hypothetical protein